MRTPSTAPGFLSIEPADRPHEAVNGNRAEESALIISVQLCTISIWHEVGLVSSYGLTGQLPLSKGPIVNLSAGAGASNGVCRFKTRGFAGREVYINQFVRSQGGLLCDLRNSLQELTPDRRKHGSSH